MSTPAREPSPAVATVPAPSAQVPAAGGYLHNVIRRPGLTCRVCAGPVGGFDRCWRCEHDGRIAGLADLVAPLSYAIAGTPSAALVRDYKNHPVRSLRERHSTLIKQLVQQSIACHEQCIGRAAGLAVSCRLTVPSLTSRPGRHPFAELIPLMGADDESPTLVPVLDAWCDRAINDKFALPPGTRLDGQHVLILDDVWTTGSNAQSAALAARRAGAAAVSVMVVGRWLSTDRRLAADFVETLLQRDYDPSICPVTGADCP